MIIDTTKIKKLICDSGIPTTKLEMGTGVSRVTISNLRSGRADWNKVWLTTLEKFQKYIDEEEIKMTIEYNGIKLVLDQDAYITGTHEEPYFEAQAHDEQGNEYMVTWYPKADWNESEIDASDACDWDNPDEVAKL